jgi:hypothetical protein
VEPLDGFRLATLFPHQRGPSAPHREVALGRLREWPAIWTADPQLLSVIGHHDAGAMARAEPHRLRYFSATDPDYPLVPLLPVAPSSLGGNLPRDESDHRRSTAGGIRDKFWQRLLVEDAGLLPQPGFAAVEGSLVSASNNWWLVRIESLDCHPAQAALLASAAPGAVVVVEGVETGFTAVATGEGIRVASRSQYVVDRLGGAGDEFLSAEEWARLVHALCSRPLPLGIGKAAHNPCAEIAEALRHAPGSYILKPRLGSNGFGVVRVVSREDGLLSVETDCPDTAAYIEEFPADPARRGGDVVAAVAADRWRFADRARVGLPDRWLGHSVVEEEIRPNRSAGSLFEPRIVVQRTQHGAGGSFAILGAICKRINTAVGACVARDFREEPLETSLTCFLRGRVPERDLAGRVKAAHEEIFAAGDRVREVIVPAVEASGATVHQFGIDLRLCWDAALGRVEYPFLEVQFGIGRIDWGELGEPSFAGYRTPAELRELFGPELG